MLREKLEAYGFGANLAEPCVFNKLNTAGVVQISLTLHVDDLLTNYTSETEIDISCILAYPIPSYHSTRGKNAQLSRNDVRLPRRMCSIRDDAENSRRCPGGMRGDKCCATPAADIFVIREAPKVYKKEAIWCRSSYVAKVLYIAKRVKPECLKAVSFLTSRVGVYDIDDLGKVGDYSDTSGKRGPPECASASDQT